MNYSAKSTHLNTTFMLLTRKRSFLLEPAEALTARARPLFRKTLTICAAALLDIHAEHALRTTSVHLICR